MADCNIEARPRNRQGRTTYWCMTHFAPATSGNSVAKPSQCSAADEQVLGPNETTTLNVADYPGGIAFWGAVQALLDTTTTTTDKPGIHTHARKIPGGTKQIDRTYAKVSVEVDGQTYDINENDAISYMICQLLGRKMKHLRCPRCQHSHLDADWFAVVEHRKHLCNRCGYHFFDPEGRGISNPLVGLRECLADAIPPQTIVSANRALDVAIDEVQGGVQIWASNPAVLWTSPALEEFGIHVHGYVDGRRVIDETYSEVRISGFDIDPIQAQVLMAQKSLPFLSGRLTTVICPSCSTPVFDHGTAAFTPSVTKTCESCAEEFAVQRRGNRRVVSNPLLAILDQLEQLYNEN